MMQSWPKPHEAMCGSQGRMHAGLDAGPGKQASGATQPEAGPIVHAIPWCAGTGVVAQPNDGGLGGGDHWPMTHIAPPVHGGMHIEVGPASRPITSVSGCEPASPSGRVWQSRSALQQKKPEGHAPPAAQP
jgi:hypothetical protein